MALLEHASSALGAGSSKVGPIHLTINVSGAEAEAGEQIQTAALRAQEQLETMLEDLLRRHRREQFALKLALKFGPEFTVFNMHG